MKLPAPLAIPCVAAAATLLATVPAPGQTQSLAFTGGVLLNTKVNFRNLGPHPAATQPGPPTGGAVDRTYDNGFNRVDAAGNPEGTTVYFGFDRDAQVGLDGLALSSASAAGRGSLDDAGDFIEPSGNLEYRGSLGPLGSLDWGLLLSIGYQSIGAKESASMTTGADLLTDRFDLGGTPPDAMPAAPYAGTPESEGPRIGSVPSRSMTLLPDGRLLSGTWEFDAELIPVTGGLYIESQLVGRLNGIVSAGVLAMIVNADLKYRETSTIDGRPPVSVFGGEGTNDVLFGGFVQLGLDWAIWEKASLVAGARWQPTGSFSHSVAGRTAELDFSAAFAVHTGFSMRF